MAKKTKLRRNRAPFKPSPEAEAIMRMHAAALSVGMPSAQLSIVQAKTDAAKHYIDGYAKKYLSPEEERSVRDKASHPMAKYLLFFVSSTGQSCTGGAATIEDLKLNLEELRDKVLELNPMMLIGTNFVGSEEFTTSARGLVEQVLNQPIEQPQTVPAGAPVH